jgi:hypothetical protein
MLLLLLTPAELDPPLVFTVIRYIYASLDWTSANPFQDTITRTLRLVFLLLTSFLAWKRERLYLLAV